MRSRTPLLTTFAARSLLALAFLFAQHTAALHWLSHAIEATQAKVGKGAAPADHCDECMTLSALSAGATSQCAVPPPPIAQYALLALPEPATSAAPLRLAFHSRAPPTLV
jgi:hypothetical protein